MVVVVVVSIRWNWWTVVGRGVCVWGGGISGVSGILLVESMCIYAFMHAPVEGGQVSLTLGDIGADNGRCRRAPQARSSPKSIQVLRIPEHPAEWTFQRKPARTASWDAPMTWQ